MLARLRRVCSTTPSSYDSSRFSAWREDDFGVPIDFAGFAGLVFGNTVLDVFMTDEPGFGPFKPLLGFGFVVRFRVIFGRGSGLAIGGEWRGGDGGYIECAMVLGFTVMSWTRRG